MSQRACENIGSRIRSRGDIVLRCIDGISSIFNSRRKGRTRKTGRRLDEKKSVELCASGASTGVRGRGSFGLLRTQRRTTALRSLAERFPSRSSIPYFLRICVFHLAEPRRWLSRDVSTGIRRKSFEINAQRHLPLFHRAHRRKPGDKKEINK